MTLYKDHTDRAPTSGRKIFILSVVILLLGSTAALAQNSKGDKPASNHSIRIIPRIKPKHKDGDRANTRDISGRRRIRTKNKSSANHIFYPARGPYVNNSAKKPSKPKIYSRTVSGKQIVRRVPNNQQRAWTSNLRGGAIGSASASRPFVTRGKKNVYWGKFSKGERPVVKDLTGRPVRTKNFRSAPLGAGRSDTLHFANRRPSREGSNFGKTRGGFLSVSGRNGRAWRGDISGHALRSPRTNSGKGRGLFSGGFKSISGRGNNRPLPVRGPGIGGNGIGGMFGRSRGKRKYSVGMSGFRGDLQQEDLHPGYYGSGGGYKGNIKTKFLGGIAAPRAGGYRGGIRREDLSPGLTLSGAGYRGGIKAQRPLRGGGSVSGKFFNNGGRPIQGRPPLSLGVGKFHGNITREDLQPSFGRSGAGYAGGIKARRPLKGGGSISGKYLGSFDKPIAVRPPGPGGKGIGNFRGNFRREDLSPAISLDGAGYSGNMRARRPLKGGGSVSGKYLGTFDKPLAGRPPGPGSRGVGKYQGQFKKSDLSPQINREGSGYSGNIRAHRPLKGGGSVSGKLWNNDEKPIAVRAPLSQGQDVYLGSIKLSRFKRYYVKNPNANEKALKKRKPGEPTYAIGGLGVKTKEDPYVKNPNSKEGALKKRKPGEQTYAIGGLGVKTKQQAYVRNPNSSKLALLKAKPSASSYKISGLGVKAKQPSYVHNPSANDKAMRTLAPGKAYAKMKDYQGNMKMAKFNDRRMHPDSKFAHGNKDNVKSERTIKTNIKLFWAKLFKKQGSQPEIVKAKSHDPQYDKKEKDLWKALYD